MRHYCTTAIVICRRIRLKAELALWEQQPLRLLVFSSARSSDSLSGPDERTNRSAAPGVGGARDERVDFLAGAAGDPSRSQPQGGSVAIVPSFNCAEQVLLRWCLRDPPLRSSATTALCCVELPGVHTCNLIFFSNRRQNPPVLPSVKCAAAPTAASLLHSSVDVRMSSLRRRSFARETLSPCRVLTTSSAIIAPPGASDKESSF